MTNQEIINEIKCLLSELDNGEDAVSYLTQNDVMWLNENIKALEQEPCEDAISREDAIKQCGFGMTSLHIADNLRKLPPVQPKPKTGHWIPSHIPESILDECSECGFSCGAFTFNYCPNCGARMIEPRKSEDKE